MLQRYSVEYKIRVRITSCCCVPRQECEPQAAITFRKAG